jgi:hypothetical protein
VSDTSEKTVSVTKPQSAPDATSTGSANGTGTTGNTGNTEDTTARGKAPSKLPPPRTVNLVCLAMAAMIVLNFAQAFLLLGWTDTLKAYLITSNANAKTPQDPFDAVHALYQLRQGSFITAGLYGVMLALLIFALRRTRSASASRWAVLIIFLYTLLPFRVIPSSGEPVAVQVVTVLVGVLSIIVLLLIFIPKESIGYFRACREANMPEGQRGQPRPGLGSLFAPRRPPADRTSVASTRRPTQPAETRPAVAKAKAKVRSDSEAVARGAELARARAKASKSRRTG